MTASWLDLRPTVTFGIGACLQYTVEHSVYVRKDVRGMGLGTRS